MSRSCPLVPGSLIPFYPLIQTMSHSNRKGEGGLRKVRTGDEGRHDKNWCRGVGDEGENETTSIQKYSQESQPTL